MNGRKSLGVIDKKRAGSVYDEGKVGAFHPSLMGMRKISEKGKIGAKD
jgi:hypothetical protein